MQTILIAVDGSGYSDRAVDYVVRRAATSREPPRLHLLNVQLPLVGVNVKMFIRQDNLEAYYREEGMSAMESARRRLEAAGLPCEHHIGMGDPAQVIVEYAGSNACDEIVMGTQGRGFLAGAIMGSVARRVIQLSAVPVVLVK